MIDKPIISAVLPIYNIQPDYLRKCLDSLDHQTFDDAEYLLIDDGSDEFIREICCEYSEKNSRFRYIPQKHSGVSDARNKGISESKGSYICFVDPDDWVSENYFDVLYHLAEESKADIGVIDSIVHYTSREAENHFLNCGDTILRGIDKNKLLYQCIGKKICDYYPPEIAAGVPWDKIFRKDFLIANDITFVSGMPRMQDNIFSLYTYESAETIAYCPICLYHYRKNSNSVSHRFNPDIISQFEMYYKETKKYLDLYNKEPVLYKALCMKELTSFNSYLTYYFYELKNRNISEINREINQLLEQEPYCTALRNIDRHLLTGQEYIFILCLKHHFHSILRMLVYLRNRKIG